jgi:Putative transposase/Transposase zinc-binding domain
MITLASIIERFEGSYLAQYQNAILPSQRHALARMKRCRTSLSPHMVAQCGGCDEQRVLPHSCGHRSCPHCQHFESQQWIERQTQRLVPSPYFLITFTVPAQLRALAWQHQRLFYALIMACAWDTLRTFSENHRQLQGTPGAVAVLHTHSRKLDFHPHVHLAMPAAALDTEQRLWRSLRSRATPGASDQGKKAQGKKGQGTTNKGYLFNHKALAKVFRGKLLAGLREAGLIAPVALPEQWVVDCRGVGGGGPALVYLGRYLYRGVVQEKDIIQCDQHHVTFRYRDSATDKMSLRTVTGATFLWLLLQHVLPKGFRRARNYGFLHPNSKRMIALLKLMVFKLAASVPTPPTTRAQLRCRCCGSPMAIIARRIQAARILPTGNAPPQPIDTKAPSA